MNTKKIIKKIEGFYYGDDQMWGIIKLKDNRRIGPVFEYPIQAENYIKRILNGSTGVKIIKLK